VNDYDKRLPAIDRPPLIRENRLYQSDWLMRFYGFSAEEIVDEKSPFLDLHIDPKLSYAIRNPHLFPVDVNKADYEIILRVPGIGVQSAQRIIYARRYRKLNADHLRKIGVVYKRAKYFITCNELPPKIHGFAPEILRSRIIAENRTDRIPVASQLSLFRNYQAVLPPIH
jgi:predicted DNA-binding helix-hairpin-helix protein